MRPGEWPPGTTLDVFLANILQQLAKYSTTHVPSILCSSLPTTVPSSPAAVSAGALWGTATVFIAWAPPLTAAGRQILAKPH